MSLFRQGSQFMIIGALQLAVDCGIFIAATAAGMPAVPANLLGRIGGAMLGFWLNGRYTFAQQGDARLGWRRFRRFAVMWLTLTLISTWLLATTVDLLGLRQAWLAKPLVEGG
ncbi:GtrA family protein, partial [Xanthomonas phaseoli]